VDKRNKNLPKDVVEDLEKGEGDAFYSWYIIEKS